MSKSNKDASANSTNDAVFQYLKDQNRPYSANDILQNLHNEYGKAAIQKALDILVQNGKVKEKVYGKQKVYVIDQSTLTSLTPAELSSMDQEIARVEEEIKKESSQLVRMELELKELNSALTTAEIISKLKELEAEVETLKDRLASNKTVKIDPAEVSKIKSRREVCVREWRRRKRIYLNMEDALLDGGYPKPKKTLHEEAGIETDEDVGVTMPKMS